jgi:hypothetical protein
MVDLVKNPWKLYNDGDTEPPQDEREFQDWLEWYFEENGWYVEREVRNKNGEGRADLIVNHSDYGWFGIETKYFDSTGPASMADAHEQIVGKYRGGNFFSKDIDLWAVCPFYSKLRWKCVECDQEGDDFYGGRINYLSQLVREFFCRHGIGYIDVRGKKYGGVIDIDFAYSKATHKIPVGYTDENTERRKDWGYVDKYEDRVENVDVGLITDSVKSKMSDLSY